MIPVKRHPAAPNRAGGPCRWSLVRPALTAVIISGQLQATFATPPQRISVVLTSAKAVVRMPASARYAVRSQVTSGQIHVGVPQAIDAHVFDHP